MASHTGSLTPAYAAPEFFRGQTSNHSDQYCLAATYCHLRGGKPPFTGEAAHVMAGHLTESPDLSMIPAEERPALARALAKEPAQRWPSCQAFVEALTQSTLDRTLPSIPSPPVASRSSRRPAMIGAAALLAGLIGLGWFFKDQIIAHGDKKTGELSVATGTGSQDVPKNGQDGGKNPSRNGAEAKSPPQQENTAVQSNAWDSNFAGYQAMTRRTSAG